QRVHHRSDLIIRQPESSKDFGYLFHFLFWNLCNLSLLAPLFPDVMLSSTFGSEVSAETHRDRTRSNLGESCGHNNRCWYDSTREPRSQPEGDRQTVRHS